MAIEDEIAYETQQVAVRNKFEGLIVQFFTECLIHTRVSDGFLLRFGNK